MINTEPLLMCWSGGKDSALALHAISKDSAYRVEALVTTITKEYERISMHGVRIRLLHEQAKALELPLQEVEIPASASNAVYENAMEAFFLQHKKKGVHHVVFGDLFLEGVRQYREKQMARLDMKALFPLWQKDTRALAKDFIDMGFRAIVVCVDPKQLSASFCGREFNHTLLLDLPTKVDPCGENGEFHTFVYDGPIFHKPVKFEKGEVTNRGGFWFCDLC